MVYHGFKGDTEIDEILKDKPNKSGFIKELIKKHAEIQQAQVPQPEKPKVFVIERRKK